MRVMCARTGLWEPRGGNALGPPGHFAVNDQTNPPETGRRDRRWILPHPQLAGLFRLGLSDLLGASEGRCFRPFMARTTGTTPIAS